MRAWLAPSACAAMTNSRRARRQGCRSRHPHEGGNREHAENAGEVEDRLSQERDDRERENQRRKGEQNVHAADRDCLEAAAEIAGQHSQRAADRDADDRRAKPDHQRNPRAVGQPRQFVAAKPVGAEPVQCREGPSPRQHVHVGRARQRQHRREDRHGKHQHHPADRCPEQFAEPASPANRTDGLFLHRQFKRGHGGSWDR